MNWKKSKVFLLGVILVFGLNAFSQTRSNSPYSIYGIGLSSDNSNPINFAMGGVSIAYRDFASINPANPASIGAISEKSFLFDVGMLMNSSRLKSSEVTEKASFATLNNLYFGFQLAKNWKVSFGLTPFSDVGYTIHQLNEDADLGDNYSIFEGSGGINKFYLTNAFSPFKNVSMGIEVGLLFGEIDRTHHRIFLDDIYHLNNLTTNTYKYSDFFFKYGIQYNIDLKENLQLTLGAVFAANTEIKTERNRLQQLVLESSASDIPSIIQTVIDTVYNTQTTLPGEISFGAFLRKADKWAMGFDYETKFWSDFKDDGVNSVYKNSTRIAIGAEFIPDRGNVFSYFKRMSYRLGFRYEKTPLYIYDTQLNEFGISFGVGLPLRRSTSANLGIGSINLGIEFGQYGKATDDLVKNSFFRFKLGVSMLQNWFVQRKYY